MHRRTTSAALILTMIATCLAIVAGPGSAQAAPLIFALKNYKSKLYLEPDGFSAGAWITQERPQAGGMQEWQWVVDGNYRSIMSNLGLKNIGIDLGSTQPFRTAILARPSGAYNQDWQVISHGNLYELKNRNSGLCLGINGASTLPGTTAMQAPCDGLANQRWEVVPW
ncbi:RICIN domain-containing protein [Actinoplanes sp. NPDC024001]|uniref:RICIN domain-containing protein n=1 Tax=Actinoplanes sp. NPDC024001 TaxID=3154598 RepID=UPI0033C64E17